VRWQGEDLAPVRSMDELKAGMTVVVTACLSCGRTHGFVLLRSMLVVVECSLHNRCLGWEIAPRCKSKNAVLCRTLAEGRLFRLKDLDDSQEAQEKELTPKKVPVKV
jgi:hypothetical protein